MHLINKNNILIFSYLLLGGLLFNSCDATKFLDEGERFTGRNRIILKSSEKIEQKSLLKEELYLLYKQDRNKNRSIGVWTYYKNRGPGDTLWYNSFFRRFFSEEPSIFNEDLAKSTASNMEDFLQNKRGFYKAKVTYNLYEEEKNETAVDYYIECGRRYYINQVGFYCQDSAINSIIQKEKDNSFLRKGNPVSSLDYDLEKNRITNLLQDKGYAQFFPNYIELVGDSADYRVNLTVNIHNPNDSTFHKKYKTGAIHVYTDYRPTQSPEKTLIDTVNGIFYHRELPEFFVHPRTISSMISLHENQLTSKKARQETYNRLSLLHPYKFIAIKPRIDSKNSTLINYDILLIPKSTKWFINYGVEGTYSTITNSSKLFGVGAHFTLENDNLFHGAERFVVNLNANTDIRFEQIKPQELYIQSTIGLFFPKPISLHKYSLFNSILKLSSKNLHNKFKNYASTKISIGAFYTSLDTTINIISGNISLGYQFEPREREIININQLAIDYYYPTLVDTMKFPGNYFKNSLSPRLITGFLFKDFSYSHTSKSLFKRFNWQLYSGFEISGHEIFLTNKLFNALSTSSDIWQFNKNKNIKFAKYLRSYLELRAQYKTSVSNSLASRFYFGLGIPYGDSFVLPYTKQFYVGGPQSLRAWEKRGIGPGAYFIPKQNEEEIAYQKGDIKLEANIEYRFDLPWYFEGAFFIDAGNVWTFKDDENLSDENFSGKFYKQIAVASGVGLRLNFNFILLRLDLGYKMRTPYIDPNSNRYWQIRNIDFIKDGYLTFGIDYPF